MIVGEQDGRGVHLSTDFLENGVAEARKVTLPGVGHLLNLQDPARFNAIILEFLEGCSDSETAMAEREYDAPRPLKVSCLIRRTVVRLPAFSPGRLKRPREKT